MTRLGYVLEKRNGTIHFFESKNELVEFVANELEQQSIEMYATETIERAVPVVTERKPTVDELYLQTLEAKYRCAALMKSKDVWSSPNMYDECLKEFNEAIEHYKKLAWKVER